MHLDSPAHSTDIITCPKCLRIYNSAQALTQHLESQANRCKARFDPNYRQVVDVVTGSIIDTAGKHDDSTPAYYASKIAPGIPLTSAHRAGDEAVHEAINDPEYRIAREKEHAERLELHRSRQRMLETDF